MYIIPKSVTRLQSRLGEHLALLGEQCCCAEEEGARQRKQEKETTSCLNHQPTEKSWERARGSFAFPMTRTNPPLPRLYFLITFPNYLPFFAHGLSPPLRPRSSRRAAARLGDTQPGAEPAAPSPGYSPQPRARPPRTATRNNAIRTRPSPARRAPLQNQLDRHPETFPKSSADPSRRLCSTQHLARR